MKTEVESPLELIIESCARPHMDGVVIGTLVATDDSGGAYIEYPSQPQLGPLPAQSTVALKEDDIGQKIALMFEMGNLGKPVIIGIIQNRERQDASLLREILPAENNTIDVQVDSKRLTLTAENEIVLRCGEASIVLTRTGKIVIRGTHLVSRSSGLNKIKGGSVKIN